MLWAILMIVGAADASGTWKLREPLNVEVGWEACRVHGAVAYLQQDGLEVRGTYEGRISCDEKGWRDESWRHRTGTLRGRVDGARVVLELDGQITLEAVIDGDRMTGTGWFDRLDEDGPSEGWDWSAGRVKH